MHMSILSFMAEWVDHEQENDQTKRTTGLGIRTRDEIGKENQMTALRFQTGRRKRDEIGKGYQTTALRFQTCRRKREESKGVSNDSPEIPDM